MVLQPNCNNFLKNKILKFYWHYYFLFLAEKHLFCNENFIVT